jgi:hypothetical protein
MGAEKALEATSPAVPTTVPRMKVRREVGCGFMGRMEWEEVEGVKNAATWQTRHRISRG